MTVKITKPSINVRSELSELSKPSGTAGEAMLRAETPQEQFNLISAGRRNILINGDMRIAQRGTSSTGQTTSGYKTCDRFLAGISSFGAHTIEQSTDAPPDFKNSLKLTCTTAETSPGSSDYLFIAYHIEGQDLSHVNFGSDYARPMTLSFWVKSNKTGTIGQEVQTSGSIERTVDVTINKAGTWEYKTVLIPPNTVNTIDETNAAGLFLRFWLNSGSVFKGTPVSTWGTDNSGRGGTLTAGIGSSVNDYFQITGVQLEVGKVATPFEHRSYGEELALCQRYYETGTHKSRGYAQDLGSGYCQRNMPDVFKVTKRANPTVSVSGVSSLGSDVDLDRVTFETFVVNLGNAFTVHDYTWTADAEL